MPMRESFLKLLNGEKADEVVWTADRSYWISGQKQAGTADPAWDTEEGYLKLTPKPAGDLSAEEMADLAASDTVILWGGVPGAMFAHPYTWDRMAEHVEGVLTTWRDRPFVLGVADQAPPDGGIDFCRQISELAASFRL